MKKSKQLLKGMCLLITFTFFALDMAAQAIHGNMSKTIPVKPLLVLLFKLLDSRKLP